MGYGADQIEKWAPWQVMAVYRGHVEANSPPQAKAPTREKLESLVAELMM